MRYVRPVELFRNERTRTWAMLVLGLLGLATAVAAVFSPEVGFALAVALIVFLLWVLVDFASDGEAKASADQQALVDAVASRLALGAQVPGVKAIYSEPRDIPFVQLLDGTRHLSVVAWFCPYLVDGERYTALKQFFADGGQADVVFPDISDGDLREDLFAMRASESEDADDIARAIRRSVRRLDQARTEGGADEGALRFFPRREPINYVAYCFDRRELVLGPYEHVFESSSRAPRLHIDLAAAGAFVPFWEHDIGRMANPDLGATAEELLARSSADGEAQGGDHQLPPSSPSSSSGSSAA
jgi:hypothetical protein